jgi:hypothetical protein
MVSTEWAEKILKEFEGRRVEGSDKQIEVYFEVSQPQLSRRQKQLNSGSPLNRLNQSYMQQSAQTFREFSQQEDLLGQT